MSTVHGQTVGNNDLAAYGCLSYISGRQQFVNGLSTVSHETVMSYSLFIYTHKHDSIRFSSFTYRVFGDD